MHILILGISLYTAWFISSSAAVQDGLTVFISKDFNLKDTAFCRCHNVAFNYTSPKILFSFTVEHTETAVFILRVSRFTLWQPNLTVLYKGKFIHSSVSATNPKHGFSVNRNFSSSAKSWRVLSHPQSLASFPPSPPSPKKWFTDRHSSSETSARQPSVYQDFCRLECGVMYLTNSVWFFISQLACSHIWSAWYNWCSLCRVFLETFSATMVSHLESPSLLRITIWLLTLSALMLLSHHHTGE